MERFPAELVLYIVDVAARASVFDRQAWVATLRLVCRSARATVDTILCHFVRVVHASMIPKIVPNELCFLAHTRTLAIDGIHLSIDECAQLVRAFSNIACLVCTSSTLVQLYHFAPRASTPAILPLRPAALFVTSGFGGVFPSEWSLPATLASVTHLAIPITPFYTLVTSHLHELRLTHVLLEAIQWHRRPHAQFYVDAIFQFLHMETLVRLVVRYTMTDDAMQAVLCEARAKVQDPRVIFDDTVVAEPASLQDVFLRDSMRGCDAWNPGQACLDCSIPKSTSRMLA